MTEMHEAEKQPLTFWQLLAWISGIAAGLSLLYVLFFRQVTAPEFVDAFYMAAFLLGAATVFPVLLDLGESSAAFTHLENRDGIRDVVVKRREARERSMAVTFALAAAALLLAGIAFLISKVF